MLHTIGTVRTMLMLINPHWTGLTSDPKLLLDVRICAKSRDFGCTFTVVWLQVCAKLNSNHKPQSQSTSYCRGYRSAPWETSQCRPEKDLRLFISCWSAFRSGHLSHPLSHLFSVLCSFGLEANARFLGGIRKCVRLHLIKQCKYFTVIVQSHCVKSTR